MVTDSESAQGGYNALPTQSKIFATHAERLGIPLGETGGNLAVYIFFLIFAQLLLRSLKQWIVQVCKLFGLSNTIRLRVFFEVFNICTKSTQTYILIWISVYKKKVRLFSSGHLKEA